VAAPIMIKIGILAHNTSTGADRNRFVDSFLISRQPWAMEYNITAKTEAEIATPIQKITSISWLQGAMAGMAGR